MRAAQNQDKPAGKQDSVASWLYGVYGPVGKGGAALFILVAFLVLPYLVVFPAVLLAWVGPRQRKGESP